ncbi:MAG: glycosyl transferase family A [Paramuribaculum sp.]|nr:glycosyl transferase family A [Paramuribaculum sp.]
MPFYKKFDEFKKVLPLNASKFERNGIEVIIVMDEPSQLEDLLGFIIKFPFINWKIIVNYLAHPWRNPSKAINVGIRHSSKKYVMVCSPESIMTTDVIYTLRESFELYTIPHYSIGKVVFSNDSSLSYEDVLKKKSFPYGSIMALKDDLIAITGYDETLKKWGGDDNNLRARLRMNGVQEMFFNEAIMLHYDNNITRQHVPSNLTSDLKYYRHIYYPDFIKANSENWGKDFNNVVYDWHSKLLTKAYLEQVYLHQFLDWNINEKIINKEFKTILLVQTFNEAHRITYFIKNAEQIFDGIILLDDSSTDNTFELAKSEKLILKVKKKRACFDDLSNRNILLNLISFFNYELAMFLDVDENLDVRFNNLSNYIGDNRLAYLVPIVNLWDYETMFNSEYPFTKSGVSLRYKMFRNFGHTQITSAKRLHFYQVPCAREAAVATQILVLHSGMLTKDLRQQKYEFYSKEDKEKCQVSYDHLIPSKSPILRNVEDITQDELNNLNIK